MPAPQTQAATLAWRDSFINPAARNMEGAIPEAFRPYIKDAFFYVIDFLPIAANSTATGSFSVQNDSDFFITAATAVVTDDGDPTTFTAFGARPFLVQQFTSGSGRNLQNRAVHIDNVFGTASLPAPWSYWKLLERGSDFSCTLQNLDPANAFDVRLTWWGFKLFAEWRGQVSTRGGV